MTIKQRINEIWMWTVAVVATIVIAVMMLGGIAIFTLGVIRWLA